MKKTEKEAPMQITYLSYDADNAGFKLIKDTGDIIAGALDEFTLIADTEQFSIYARGDISERGTSDQSRVYVLVHGMGIEYFIRIEPYLVGKNFRTGEKHFDHSTNLLKFLSTYTPYFSVLPLFLKQYGL